MRRRTSFRAIVAGVLALVAGTSLAAAHSVKKNSLEIVHPWVYESAAAGVDALVSMRIRNAGKGPDRLIGAASPMAASVEIVATAPDAPATPGATTAPTVAIPAAGVAELSRSGTHLVMKGLKSRLTVYAMVPVTLRFERAGAVAIEVMVEERPAEGPHAGHE